MYWGPYIDDPDLKCGTRFIGKDWCSCTGLELLTTVLSGIGAAGTTVGLLSGTPEAPPVSGELDPKAIESAQAKAERELKRKRASAAERAKTNFTSSLGAPRKDTPNTIKTALGGFSNG